MSPTWEFLIRLLQIRKRGDEKERMSPFQVALAEQIRKCGGIENVKLPVGTVFSPKEHELIIYYLVILTLGFPLPAPIIKEIDGLFNLDPRHLADQFRKTYADQFRGGKPDKAYFLTNKSKCSTGLSSEMTTENGYWKLVNEGEEAEEIEYNNYIIGFKNTFVFYKGKAPSGIETSWVIEEYRFNSSIIPSFFLPEDIKKKMDTCVVCRMTLEKEHSENKFLRFDITDIPEIIFKRSDLDDEDTESKFLSVETIESTESP